MCTKRQKEDATFGLVVRELVVGETKPSLFKVFHSESVSSLRSLYHKSERGGRERHIQLKIFIDEPEAQGI